MKLIQKYVLREFMLPLAYCFCTFYGLYVLCTLFSAFKKIAEAHPSTGFVICYLTAYMSPYIVWLLPASLMLAALYTMWRFCHHSEIIAMRANGLSYATIVTPLLSVAALAALLCAVNQEFYAPQGREFARRAEKSNFRPPPPDIRSLDYYNYAARRIWHVNRMNLDNPRILEGVRITIERPDGRQKLVDISCQRAEHLDGVWWLYNPQYRYFDEQNNLLDAPTNPLLKLTVRPMPHFNEQPRDFVIEGKEWDYLSLRDMLAWIKAHPQTVASDKLYDIHARMAMPWACLVITLFAIPAGVATGRQSVFKGVLLAIALFFGFYMTTMGCALLAKNDDIQLTPWIAAWIPNVAFLGAGVALFARLR
ncbi:MAG: LptF/LptG family permease [Magnetococcus sp. WYHC-3]